MIAIKLLATVLIALQIQQAPVQTPQSKYDPSKSLGKFTVSETEFEYGDNESDKRTVPLKIYLPKSKSKAPVILFSHGLGGSRNNNPYLGNHWAGRGFVVVFMQHAGSDETVWKDAARRDRMRSLRSAASAESFNKRTKDVSATLDQLEKWNKKDGKLAGRINLKRVGLSGHSFGAVTTQALSGQNFGRKGQVYTDDRIKAALAMSPSPPRIGNNAKTFGKVRIPWMLMTGTRDESIIATTSPEDRLKVFGQLPTNGNSYQLVLHDAQHLAFSESKLNGGAHRNPKHHQSILAVSSAFWDAQLNHDKTAKKWLDGEQVKKVLEPKDLWERK